MEDPQSSYQERLARGELVDLRPESGKHVDASDGASWGPDRCVEASTLMSLLTASVGSEQWSHRPLRLAGARITGSLNLEFATLTRPLHLLDCHIVEPVRLNNADAVAITLPGCHVQGIYANGLHTRGDLRLSSGFTSAGNVNLYRAHIGGTLTCAGGTFTNQSGYALTGISMIVGGNALCTGTFSGKVTLAGAHIGGHLVCDGGTFRNGNQIALDAEYLTIDGSMSCSGEFESSGTVSLQGAHIGGDLVCEDGTFSNERRVALNAISLTVGGIMRCTGTFTGLVNLTGARVGVALICDGGTFDNGERLALDAGSLTVAGDMLCGPGFTATGMVKLQGSQISGQLFCGGSFSNPDRMALDASSLTVAGDMLCTEGFTATGEVNLAGAHIRGALLCNGGTFSNKTGSALNAISLRVDGSMRCTGDFTGLVNLMDAHVGGKLDCQGGSFRNENDMALLAQSIAVDGDMFCTEGFKAIGEVNLTGAHVRRALVCDGGAFTNENKVALNAHSLTVDGDMLCGPGFVATGRVDLMGAHIDGQLLCHGGTFNNPNDIALIVHRAEIVRGIFFYPSAQTSVDISFARVGSWHDAEETWPAPGNLYLNGCTYAVIDAEPPVSVRDRLRWLQLDAGGFLPQPYDQLANAFRLHGDEAAARKVQVSAQWHRRAAVSSRAGFALRPFRILWSALLWATVGYGYRPWQIMAPIGILYGFGCWWFTRAAQHGGIVRTQGLASQVHFNGARYAADLLIPGASLGERAHFLAVGQTAWWAAAFTLAGWALAAMLIAGLTGVFKRP